MWQTTEAFDAAACVGAPGHSTPLAAFDVLWHYAGHGVIPQGYLDPAEEVLAPPSRFRPQELFLGPKKDTLVLL
jgi:hypothetical protein